MRGERNKYFEFCVAREAGGRSVGECAYVYKRLHVHTRDADAHTQTLYIYLYGLTTWRYIHVRIPERLRLRGWRKRRRRTRRLIQTTLIYCKASGHFRGARASEHAIIKTKTVPRQKIQCKKVVALTFSFYIYQLNLI